MSDLPELHKLPHGVTPVVWRRSRAARLVSLRIDPSLGGVVITLPLRVAKSSGLALLKAQSYWVAERLRQLPKPIELAQGGEVMIDGAAHEIIHKREGRGGAWITEGRIEVTGEPEFLARRVTDLLRHLAKQRFTALAWEKSALIGKKPLRVTIKDTRTRWGSCTADGVLMLNWRLIMAPPYVQDYVVGHEVAHLQHLDHSKQFWQLTAQLTPHTDAAQTWLKHNGSGLLRVR